MVDLIGNKIPDINLVKMDSEKGPQPLSVLDFCKDKKVVMFGVPGAFTPTCSRNHLPGFIDKADEMKARGVDAVICFATNDIFTLSAWEEMSGSIGKILFL